MTYFKPVWCRQIEPGAENEMFSFFPETIKFFKKQTTQQLCTY